MEAILRERVLLMAKCAQFCTVWRQVQNNVSANSGRLRGGGKGEGGIFTPWNRYTVTNQ